MRYCSGPPARPSVRGPGPGWPIARALHNRRAGPGLFLKDSDRNAGSGNPGGDPEGVGLPFLPKMGEGPALRFPCAG